MTKSFIIISALTAILVTACNSSSEEHGRQDTSLTPNPSAAPANSTSTYSGSDTSNTNADSVRHNNSATQGS